MSLQIAFLVYPDVTQLDLTGPYEVLARVPGANVQLVWKDRGALRSDSGLTLAPSASFAEVQQADVLCIPGGAGQIPLMEDTETLDWIAKLGSSASFVTSVCVGSFLLGAAGLLQGYRATTHWASLELLSAYGAMPSAERVVIDRNRITGAGVTAGIDFGLSLAGLLSSEQTAREIQLAIEYDPAPAAHSGHPRSAASELVQKLRERFAPRVALRSEQARRFASGLVPA